MFFGGGYIRKKYGIVVREEGKMTKEPAKEISITKIISITLFVFAGYLLFFRDVLFLTFWQSVFIVIVLVGGGFFFLKID